MKKRLDVTIPNRHPAARIACGFMALSAIVRLWHYLSAPMDALTLWVHVVMPVSAAVIFLLGVLRGGRAAKTAAVAATALGVAFFIIKAAEFTPVHRTLCTILYVTVLILFSSTLLGLVPTKKLLYPLFGLPLVYHILVEDTQLYFFANPPVPVWYWMPEISVLCIMAALLCLSVSLKTKKL